MEKLFCKQCSGTAIVKCGIRNTIQRYQCRDCKNKFQCSYLYNKHSKTKKKNAIQLYLEGLGIRSIGRYLKVSHVSVIRWILKSPVVKWKRPSTIKAMEIDEVYFYVGNKKRKRWLWLAVCRESKRIIAHQIGKRDRPTVRKLIQKLSAINCFRYYTDAHLSYHGLFPQGKHYASKKYTYTIEGINSAIRHYLARFRRRSKCYSKNEYMTDKSIHLLSIHLHKRYIQSVLKLKNSIL